MALAIGGDDSVFWNAALTLGCGAASTAAALYGCENQVLELFAPKLGWLIFAPSFLAVLLGLVGIRASRRPASKLLRLQLAVVLMLISVLLGGAGAFAFVAAGTTAQCILDGCDGFTATGLWTQARRIEEKMQMVHEQYNELRCGWERCRQLDPLVFDLADCGVRARCGGHEGRLSDAVPLYGWFQHQELTMACGGFCADEAPLFGPTSMRESLPLRPACADGLASSLRSQGQILGSVAGLVAVPLICGAFALFHAGAGDDDGELLLQDSDMDDGDIVRFHAGAVGRWNEDDPAE